MLVMKKVINFLIMLLLCFTFATFIGPKVNVYAAQSGTCGSCSWTISDDGIMRVYPTSGTSGTLATYRWPTHAPWWDYRKSVKHLIIEPGVRAGASCYQLFADMSNCTNFEVTNLDTSTTSSFDDVLRYNSSVTSYDVSTWNTGNATYLGFLFGDCSNLKFLDLSNFYTSNVTNMHSMLSSCSNLESLDISNFDTSRVTDMEYMFHGCSKLKLVKLSPYMTKWINNAYLPTPSGACYTGKWIKADGTAGPLTPSQLYAQYPSHAAEWAGEWVWEIMPCAVFTDDGTLYFVRPSEAYEVTDGVGTVHSVSGDDYTGRIFGVKDTSSGRTWDSIKAQVQKVVFVDEMKPTNLSEWFRDFSACTEFDLAKLNTSNCTTFESLFWGCSSVQNVDVGHFDTSHVTSFRAMFYQCVSLESIDLSSFNTSLATNMVSMLSSCRVLKTVTFGENFDMDGVGITESTKMFGLQSPWGDGYTGKWIRADQSFGPYTVPELIEAYTPSMAGVWVWEEIPTEYVLIFNAGENGTGSMPNVSASIVEDFMLPVNQFVSFGYDFDHWDDGQGHEYDNKGVISADTYEAGQQVTLTANWKKRDTSLNWDGNEATFSLKAGEQALIDNIPSGTSYQVYELTPDGWILVQQENASGVIEALEESSAAFWNKYQPGITTVQFSGLKTLDGRPATAGAYTFELYEGETLIDTAVTQDGGFIQFKVIEYDAIGNHVYIIREVDPSDDSIDYDIHEETVMVEVTEDDNGHLSNEVTYDNDGIKFENITRPGRLLVTKNAQNVTDENAEDTFTIEIEFRNESGMPINDNIYWYVENGTEQTSEVDDGH